MVGAAGRIALAQKQLDDRDFPLASATAKAAALQAPLLADYAFYIQAEAEAQLKNFESVSRAATRIFGQAPPSPLIGPAAALAVRANLDGDHPKEALALVRKYFDEIPQPEADLLLARCFEGTGDLPQAAEYFNRVYYSYPNAHEASDAADALVRLKDRLGDTYPPPMPHAMLDRAAKLFDAHKAAAAKIELAAAIPQLGGSEHDVASVRLGVADFLAGDAQSALDYLSQLHVEDPEADAERLNYAIRSARKLARQADVKPFLDTLEALHPASPFRMDALIFAADQARIDHNPAIYLPLYRTCADTFRGNSRAAWCHWQLAFTSYARDEAGASDLLRTHISDYPASEEITDALYFLARLKERRNDLATAHACYQELVTRFPNTYFATIARQRLTQPALLAATSNAATRQFFQEVNWPPPPQFPSFSLGPLAQTRVHRAQLLQATGLTSFADGELRYGAVNDNDQLNVYAFELAKLASDRSEPDQALRYIKRYSPGYLYMPFDQAPPAFWRLAFPLPYRAEIEQHSHQQSLDPFFVSALIRQESEFKVDVISYANAYGLMQVLPATGRELARQEGIRRFASRDLLTADSNVRLGTRYVHDLMNSFGGREEYVLASYNAGPSRARLWETWGPFREQAEFIEAIPFHQTRTYVQVVLRNADVYRKLYSGTAAQIPAYKPKPAPPTKVRAPKKGHRTLTTTGGAVRSKPTQNRRAP